jgi:hypothetical protein
LHDGENKKRRRGEKRKNVKEEERDKTIGETQT